MKKLTILPTNKIANMDAAGIIAAKDGREVQYLPQPVVTSPNGDEETLIGIDFLKFMAGKRFDKVEIDPRVEAKGQKLKMHQKTFIASLKK